ncbi:uncharacterized protein SETTUDRAFT_28838 [Exserohilum turcica Et28A]|uniref:Sodium/calcium exchanger membrane region domain-containing protein n=1 Tax=Exserohilum turcicum (strain 28A) TaxID=671987 RepID=R0IM40_EXST2|nr:uncharacterized protein SETTUDRAFT_28838 [Exserohilum turcica Et28A]EOA85881.1 hypothetical protein SETTUDRAFT_28838 [Exserohilum turcica Et28A]
MWTLEDMLEEISTVHRILLCYSVAISVAIEWLRLNHEDTLLSIFVEMVQFAVVVDCILIITYHLMHLSASNRMLATVVYQTPLVTGPLAEFELTRLMLMENATTAANIFLVGCMYAKPLVAGALCLVLHNLYIGGPGMQPHANILTNVSKVFLRSAALAALFTYGVGLESLPILTAAAGDSLWLSRGVPILLLLSISLACYFWYWYAEKYRDIASKSYNSRRDPEWIVLLVCLVALKLAAANLVHSVWKQIRGVALTMDEDIAWESSDAVVQFAILPLATAAVDHLADISAAYRGDIYWSWISICQSTLQTFFLIRPLFVLVGHDLDPRSGRIGIAMCFLGIALWLSLPIQSRLLKGSVLLLMYSGVVALCAAHFDYFNTHIS